LLLFPEVRACTAHLQIERYGNKLIGAVGAVKKERRPVPLVPKLLGAWDEEKALFGSDINSEADVFRAPL
jgi:hypothetical protein